MKRGNRDLRQWAQNDEAEPIVADVWSGDGKHESHTSEADTGAKCKQRRLPSARNHRAFEPVENFIKLKI